MHLTSQVDSAKTGGIFYVIEEMFVKHEIPSKNCLSLSVDNTNAMIEQKMCSQDSWRKLKILLL